jgi:hypothetical protein
MAYALTQCYKNTDDWTEGAKLAAIMTGEVTWTYLLSQSPGSKTGILKDVAARESAGTISIRRRETTPFTTRIAATVMETILIS